MSIQQFFRILWARRSLLGITFLAALLGAVAIIKLVPPSYDATSRIMLDEILRPDPVTGEAIGSKSTRAFTKTQTELITDARVAGRAVDALGWTGSAQLAAEYQASGSEMDFRRWLSQRIMDRTRAEMAETSNILEITYSGDNPELVAAIADALRASYEEQTIAFKRQAATRNAVWLEQQTVELRAKLNAAEQRKADFERKSGVILQDEGGDTESARLAALAATPPSAAMTMPGAMPSPSLTQLAQVDAAIVTATQSLGPNHPDLQNMQRQRAVLAAAAGRESAASRPTSSGPSVGAMYAAQRNRVLSQRGELAEGRQLLGDVMLLREQLTKAAQRTAQLQQEAQSTEVNLTRLGSAVAPDQPTFPRTVPVLGGSLALGLGLGILLALLTELLDRRVRGGDDLDLEDVPLLGVFAADPADRPKALGWRGRIPLLADRRR